MILAEKLINREHQYCPTNPKT